MYSIIYLYFDIKKIDLLSPPSLLSQASAPTVTHCYYFALWCMFFVCSVPGEVIEVKSMQYGVEKDADCKESKKPATVVATKECLHEQTLGWVKLV